MGRQLARIAGRRAGRRRIVATVLACMTVAFLAALQRWPLWAMALATLAPVGPLLGFEAVATYRRYNWLGVFYVLTVAQVGHLIEHAVQIDAAAHPAAPRPTRRTGSSGSSTTSGCTSVWNNSVALLVLLLLVRFRHNLWLWLTAVLSTWHGTEHVAIIWPYLTTGLRGAPPACSPRVACSAGGLPLSALELHYYYNLLETAPLVFAFLAECKRVYDERDRPAVCPGRRRRGRSWTCSSSYQQFYAHRAARSNASRDRGPGRQRPGAPPGAPPAPAQPAHRPPGGSGEGH